MGVFSTARLMASERTFLAIKPDGVQRNLVGEIIARFERKGFQLVGLKMISVPKELAEEHYAEHKGRPFFQGLIDFITSGPVVAMVWQGENVVAGARTISVPPAPPPLPPEPSVVTLASLSVATSSTEVMPSRPLSARSTCGSRRVSSPAGPPTATVTSTNK